MVRDTPPYQDASTYQIWDSYLKEYRRYALDTKRDGRMDRRTLRVDSVITICLPGIKRAITQSNFVGDLQIRPCPVIYDAFKFTFCKI